MVALFEVIINSRANNQINTRTQGKKNLTII
jgi:hypothetical protein